MKANYYGLPVVESLILLKDCPHEDSMQAGQKLKLVAQPTGEVFSYMPPGRGALRVPVFTMDIGPIMQGASGGQ